MILFCVNQIRVIFADSRGNHLINQLIGRQQPLVVVELIGYHPTVFRQPA
jgi:hypothetical protein